MALLDSLTFGTCYYPEHWPATMWADDLRRMRDAGFEVVRMGEGAWGYFEPEEGRYQFETFDRVLDLCQHEGLKVIFGTPTYCGPAWIAHNYPEVLRWNFNRIPMMHGSRRNYNYTSAKYLDLSDRICTALAQRYKDHPAIVAWQLDNEFNCHMDVSYAPSDTVAFRQWLKEKYGTLEALNAAWGTAFWSQGYSDWAQLDLPHPTATYLNPTLLLDEVRFISDCVIRFARRQAGILRSANPTWEITHNGLFANIDGPALVRELDFFSHDHYPLFNDCDWVKAATSLAVARSLSEPFCIMEHQAGPGGQMEYLHRTLYPGELRRLCWQSLAHGTRSLLWFLWRTCPFGSEQHWHGLHDQDDKPTRRLEEAKQVVREAKSVGHLLAGARVKKVAAVLRDFDSETNEGRVDRYVGAGAWEAGRVLAGLLRRHIPADFAWTNGRVDLSEYKLVIAPHLKLLTAETLSKLRDYLAAGGVLVLTAQSGLKDQNNHIVRETPPGLLAELTGCAVEEWTVLKEPAAVNIGNAKPEFIAFAEVLKLHGARAVGTYAGTHPLLRKRPAVTVNQVGAGKVLYVGGYLPESAVEAVLSITLAEAGVQADVARSETVEVIEYEKFVVLINHGTAEETIQIGEGTTVFGPAVRAGSVTLAGGDVAVVEKMVPRR